jgi:hypothetical protein
VSRHERKEGQIPTHYNPSLRYPRGPTKACDSPQASVPSRASKACGTVPGDSETLPPPAVYSGTCSTSSRVSTLAPKESNGPLREPFFGKLYPQLLKLLHQLGGGRLLRGTSTSHTLRGF